MFSDLCKAIFFGPLYFRIFSGLLLLLSIIWLIIWARLGLNPVTKEEKDKLSPRVEIKLFPRPTHKVNSLIKEYILKIANLNNNSVPIIDFRANFFFPYLVQEVQSLPLFNTGTVSVSGVRVEFGKFKYEEKPVETSITKKFSLEIQKAIINGQDANTNEIVFNCSKWPEGVDFSGNIIIDTNKKPNILKTPEKIGTYEGLYFYEIKGKKFSEKVSGKILDIEDIK